MTVPNFNYADRIEHYLEQPDDYLLEELKGYREAHPRKFLAALAWGWGRKSNTYKRIETATRVGGH
jgi:hypothetical protein